MELCRPRFVEPARQVLEEFLPMAIPRNDESPTTSLQERLLKFAEEARAAAGLVVPGREQDELLRKARKAETLANAADGLALAGSH